MTEKPQEKWYVYQFLNNDPRETLEFEDLSEALKHLRHTHDAEFSLDYHKALMMLHADFAGQWTLDAFAHRGPGFGNEDFDINRRVKFFRSAKKDTDTGEWMSAPLTEQIIIEKDIALRDCVERNLRNVMNNNAVNLLYPKGKDDALYPVGGGGDAWPNHLTPEQLWWVVTQTVKQKRSSYRAVFYETLREVFPS